MSSLIEFCFEKESLSKMKYLVQFLELKSQITVYEIHAFGHNLTFITWTIRMIVLYSFHNLNEAKMIPFSTLIAFQFENALFKS